MPVTPYDPRHAATTATARRSAATDAGRQSAFAALFRRRPDHVHRIAIGAIGVGTALFIAATVAHATPGDSHRHLVPQAAAAPAVHQTGDAMAAAVGLPPATTEAPAPAVAAAKQVHSRLKAPATRQVISGLAANGIPNVALNAYRVAAARMAHADPSCGIDWAMLAGIGREESDHGRFAGATLNPDGTSTPRIIGPALDGTHSDYIAAPANGAALDGDAKYTHALGPMQFIPQTWAAYGADANGDGTADIFNINDAALGAARYLCANGGDLRTQAGRVRAVLAYNHNDEYLAQVLALAEAYRTGVAVTGTPVGQVYGALPPITPGDPYAVNPGAPTAVGSTLGRVGTRNPGRRSGAPVTTGTPQRSPGGTHTSGDSNSGAAAGTTSSTSAARPGGGTTSKPSSAPKPAPSSSAPSTPAGGVAVPVLPTGTTSTPAPAPSPTCKLGLGGICVIG
jgi:membrane-bound lytic murein transglycosylase B